MSHVFFEGPLAQWQREGLVARNSGLLVITDRRYVGAWSRAALRVGGSVELATPEKVARTPGAYSGRKLIVVEVEVTGDPAAIVEQVVATAEASWTRYDPARVHKEPEIE